MIIFDCDGVLVDSEPLAAAVFSELLAAVGITLSAQQCYEKFHGHSLRYCFDWLEQTAEKPLPDDFGERLACATRDAFNQHLKPVSGVEQILQMLVDHNVSYCVASNGGHKKIASSLATTGLDKFFNQERGNCFSIEDVHQGKPAPDLFLHAAEVMGVPARFTTVIEDSPSGMSAALAAGMNLFVYDENNAYADSEYLTFASMVALGEYLQARWRR